MHEVQGGGDSSMRKQGSNNKNEEGKRNAGPLPRQRPCCGWGIHSYEEWGSHWTQGNGAGVAVG